MTSTYLRRFWYSCFLPAQKVEEQTKVGTSQNHSLDEYITLRLLLSLKLGKNVFDYILHDRLSLPRPLGQELVAMFPLAELSVAFAFPGFTIFLRSSAFCIDF
jgi:hypothetical protein